MISHPQCLLISDSGINGIFVQGVVAYICNNSSWELKAEESGVQGQPKLYNEFEVSLDYMSLLTKKKTTTTKNMCQMSCTVQSTLVHVQQSFEDFILFILTMGVS